MADAVAHGVTKTTPNATHRVAPHGAGLRANWAVWRFRPFAAASGTYPATYDQQRTHSIVGYTGGLGALRIRRR